MGFEVREVVGCYDVCMMAMHRDLYARWCRGQSSGAAPTGA